MKGVTKKRVKLKVDVADNANHSLQYICENSRDSIKKTLDHFGVAIVPSVFSPEECDHMKDGMWSFLEQKSIGITRDNPESYKNFFKLLPSHSMLIQHWEIGHCQMVWDVRQNPKVVSVFSKIWNTQDLLVSFDGASFHMPHEETKRGYFKGNTWYHSDQRFSDSSFQCVQGWVTAFDVTQGDATLSIFEGSHKYHREFSEKFQLLGEKKDWYKMSSQEQVDFYVKEKKCQVVDITCPAGSFVLWDSRTIHCGKEPEEGRKSSNFRCVAYTCYMPRTSATKKDIEKKRAAFKNKRTTSHWANKAKLFGKKPNTFGAPGERPDFPGIPENEPVLTELGKKLAGF